MQQTNITMPDLKPVVSHFKITTQWQKVTPYLNKQREMPTQNYKYEHATGRY